MLVRSEVDTVPTVPLPAVADPTGPAPLSNFPTTGGAASPLVLPLPVIGGGADPGLLIVLMLKGLPTDLMVTSYSAVEPSAILILSCHSPASAPSSVILPGSSL